MEFYGIVGEKLSHSLSPKIHKRVFEILQIEGAYKTFEISKKNIKDLGKSLRFLNIKGVNVTIPYKDEVMNQLDFISDEAKKIGAINTIYLKDSKLSGYNTDYFGFQRMLEVNNIQAKGKVAVVLGNGGAAKAIVANLLSSKVSKLYLVDRNKKEDNIDSNITLIDYNELKDIKGDILINTTPVGMYPNVGHSVVNKDIISKYNTLVDIIYNPKMTEFLKLGKELGLKTCDGLYMLVSQGIKSQEIWQERDIEDEVINKIYKELEKEF